MNIQDYRFIDIADLSLGLTDRGLCDGYGWLDRWLDVER